MTRTIAIVTNIPRPYRRALFGTLREQLAAADFALRIFYTSDPSRHVRRGAPAAVAPDPELERYVSGHSLRTSYERVLSVPTGLGRVLSECSPECVVVGGFSVDAMVVARWCRVEGVPRILWSGAWPGREGKTGPFRRYLRRRLVQTADAFVAYGSASADYLAALGARPDRVFCAWNTVDLEAIASAAKAAAGRRPDLVDRYGLAEKNLLFVGTLVETKGVRELLAAAMEAKPLRHDWALHFLGAGPMRSELERRVRETGASHHFRFHGLRPPSDIADLLGVADGLLLPTKREAWGLVINEAMACGVPVVVSPLAGATRDLVEDGVSGFVVDPDDTAHLASLIARLVDGDPRCREVGYEGARVVREKASLKRSAEGFLAAITCATAGRRHG